MRTMVWKTVGSVFVLRESNEMPSDDEWDSFLSSVAEYQSRVSELRVLVLTDGGGPNATQRNRIKDVLRGRPFRSAVVSDNMKIRFIASAIMLIAKNHGSFTLKEMERAYSHLSLTLEERRAVDLALPVLEKELNVKPLRA